MGLQLLCGTTCLVLGSICSAIGFHLRNSLLFDSALNLIISSGALKVGLVKLLWTPQVSVPAFSVLAFAGFCLMVLVLRIAAGILGRRLSLGQLFTLVFWTAANFLFLLPLSPIFYRILNQTNWGPVAVFVVVVFFGWFSSRLFAALRVIFHLTLVRAGILVGILFTLTFGVAAFYYQEQVAIFDYLPMYWRAFLET